MYIKTNGLVLRETPYKESSRILTVLTEKEGKLTVSARGAKRQGSKTAASTQFLAYSEMTLFHERGRYVLTEARSVELFEGLRDDVALLSLGAYFAELLETLSNEGMPDPDVMSLGLNALYALSSGKYDPALVKAAFELRLMCLSGYEPALDGCAICGREDIKAPVLSLTGGVVRCTECRTEQEGERITIPQGVLDAMRHIIAAPAKRLYSFTLSDDTAKQLSRVCEAYLINQLGTGFRSLDFYRSIV